MNCGSHESFLFAYFFFSQRKSKLFNELYLEAVADTCGVSVVGIDVHFETESSICTDLYVVEGGAAFAVCFNGDVVAVLYAEFSGIVKAHVNVSVGNDATFLQRNHAFRTDDGNGRGACDVTGFTNGGFYLQNVRVGSGDLNLRALSDGSENANALDGTERRSDDGQLLFASILTGLRKILEGSQLITLTEKNLYVFLRQMDVTVGNADGNESVLRLCFSAADFSHYAVDDLGKHSGIVITHA